jgi:putative acetyltransferase
MTRIRVATHSDRDDIRAVYLAAFPEVERDAVATLAVDLLAETTSPEIVTLVAEKHTELVGHIALSPVTAVAHTNWQGYVLAPLAVAPAYQKTGVGTALIETGIALLADSDVDALFVYGDPGYYGRLGFSAAPAARYRPPYDMQQAFGWQAIILRNEISAAADVALTCVQPLSNPALW